MWIELPTIWSTGTGRYCCSVCRVLIEDRLRKRRIRLRSQNIALQGSASSAASKLRHISDSVSVFWSGIDPSAAVVCPGCCENMRDRTPFDMTEISLYRSEERRVGKECRS